MTDLERLAIPLPPQYVQQVRRGNGDARFVAHGVVTQRLLGTLGPFDMRVVELIRGQAPEVTTRERVSDASGHHCPPVAKGGRLAPAGRRSNRVPITTRDASEPR